MLRAIYMFLKQDYPNKELIIIDDSPNISKVPKYGNITYVKLNKRHTLGDKRNIAINAGHGDIFIFWDDDDVYGTNRITKQVKPIIESGFDITVFMNVIYHDVDTDMYYKTDNKTHHQLWYNGYVCGSMASKRCFWKLKPFNKIKLGEDKKYIEHAIRNGAKIKTIRNHFDHIYTRHKTNTYQFTNDIRKIVINTLKIPKCYRTGLYNINAYNI
jgi:glycosyltransferase involved in cell wall biosynthesis